MTRVGRPIRNKYFCVNCKDQNLLIECECGCSQLLFKRDDHYVIRKRIRGHCMNRELNPNYKGGRKKHENYWMLLLPDYYSSEGSGYVKEHIYFFQEYWQCCMLPWGVVHHIIPVSKDYCNNMPWNLMGMTIGQHSKLHRKYVEYKILDKTDRRCYNPECKDPDYRYFDKKGREQWYKDHSDNWLCRKCYNKWYDMNKRQR